TNGATRFLAHAPPAARTARGLPALAASSAYVHVVPGGIWRIIRHASWRNGPPGWRTGTRSRADTSPSTYARTASVTAPRPSDATAPRARVASPRRDSWSSTEVKPDATTTPSSTTRASGPTGVSTTAVSSGWLVMRTPPSAVLRSVRTLG